MANEEQLKILKQGVDVWNMWREDNPDIKVDLYKVDLRISNLRNADFRDADLRLANLLEANLGKADLRGSNLSGANLSYANLSGTDIRAANLYMATIYKANLTDSEMGYTILGNADFMSCIGLETIRHYSPSTISLDTIQLFQGKIPNKFLRGCGLSDFEIEFAKLADPDLGEKEIIDIAYKIGEMRAGGFSIRYNSLFISYSFKDQNFAQRLYNDLQNSGVRCWFAPHDMQGGKKIHEQIDAAIRTHDRVLLVISEHSMNSEWIKTEIANARQKEINENRKVLFPIRIIDYQKIRSWKNFDADTGKDSAREIREYYIPDFSGWQDPAAYQPSFKRLLQDLKA